VASLIAALRVVGWAGGFALGLLLLTLAINIASYVTATQDMAARRRAVEAGDRTAVFGNRWTKATTILNYLAGAGLLAGGFALAIYAITTKGATR